MGLYLCIFDRFDEEIAGVEVGSYADFGDFRNAVVANVEQGNAGEKCPILILHSDSDGEWSTEQSRGLLKELSEIKTIFSRLPPVEYNSDWKKQIARQFRIKKESLLDCYFDVDGEPLIDRLIWLASTSIDAGRPISFQ